jgi:hypothetical protein
MLRNRVNVPEEGRSPLVATAFEGNQCMGFGRFKLVGLWNANIETTCRRAVARIPIKELCIPFSLDQQRSLSHLGVCEYHRWADLP